MPQSTVAFDATDFDRLAQFFDELVTPIDHVLVTGPGPYYAPLAEFDFERARRDVEAHLFLPLQVARPAATANKVRPGGTLLFMGALVAAARPIRDSLSSRLSPLRCPPSPPVSRSNSRLSESTSSLPASSTHRCRHRSSAMSLITAAISFAPRFRSGASSHRATSPRLPYTS